MRDPSADKLRKLIGWHRADGIEVEIAAVPLRRLRVKDVGSLHTKLTFENVGNQRFWQIGCAQCACEHWDKLRVCDMADGQQVLLHPNGIPDAETPLGRESCDGGVL